MKLMHALKEIRVQDAVGLRLGHDLTRIVPGEFKGRAFRRGHLITPEDIPLLQDIGKEHIYILNIPEGWLHEEDAAIRMAQATAGENVETTPPSEGKVTLKSTILGLAKMDESFVHEVNAIEHVVFSTIRNNTTVQQGMQLAATRVVPLLVEERTIVEFERVAARHLDRSGSPLVQVKPFRSLRAGIITTGSEVFTGRVDDKFGPVLRSKLEALGSEVMEQRFSPDDTDSIVQHIDYFRSLAADLILVTGGMSVDPDDRTPGAIKKSGASIVSYGTPMLPGSMMLMGYLPPAAEGTPDTPVMGLPGAVIYEPFTSFDVLLPRICAGERIDRADIVVMGYGGLLK
jgi:molybdenum cofactor synthesis domain-containing protein